MIFINSSYTYYTEDEKKGIVVKSYFVSYIQSFIKLKITIAEASPFLQFITNDFNTSRTYNKRFINLL